MGKGRWKMGAVSSILLQPLVLTLLLGFVPLSSHAWSFFSKPPPPSSSASAPSSSNHDPTSAAKNLASAKSKSPLQSPTTTTTTGTSTGKHINTNTAKAPYYSQATNNFWYYYSIPIPKFFSETVTSYLRPINSLLQTVFLYKPPVGITSVYVLLKFALSRKSKKLISYYLLLDDSEAPPSHADDSDDAVNLASSKRSKYSIRTSRRSLDLDKGDGHYDNFGGVEAVRTELCLAALCDVCQLNTTTTTTTTTTGTTTSSTSSTVEQEEQPFDLTNAEQFAYYLHAVQETLMINVAPRTTREYYVEKTIPSLAKLQNVYKHMESIIASTDSSSIASKRPTKQTTTESTHNQLDNTNNDIADILLMASKVAEIRTLDALLRILRERLLTSAIRLSRKEKHRAWRLKWYEKGFGKAWKRWYRKTMKGTTLADDRRNLQLTSAALKREMERLGQVQKLLLLRPLELSETTLLMAASATVDEFDGTRANHSKLASNNTTNVAGCVGKIDSLGARMALRSSYKMMNQSSDDKQNDQQTNNKDQWIIEAHLWTQKSRELIRDLVTESVSSAFDPSERLNDSRDSTVSQDLAILQEWSMSKQGDIKTWTTALNLVDDLSKARLLREKKFLPTAMDLKQLAKRVDIYGIPSSLAPIGLSVLIHNFMKPRWPLLVDTGKNIGKAIWGIIEFRFWVPIRDITLDLLNKRPKMLDPFALENEQMSLDNMLRDLGIGDGTKNNRAEALAKASRMYEEELKQGAIKNLLRGRMVHLLLIQMQQLKAGLLEAMGSIDHLVDSNRLNVQLLASIPAFLLVTFGTRLFFAALFSLRTRDIIGLPAAHAEMTDLLRKMERCLLLASYEKDMINSITSTKNMKNIEEKSELVSSPTSVTLESSELGEFVLQMHSYLVLLDFCSPPFPNKSCDSIHSDMQELLMQGQLTTKRQIALLQLITAKHDDLLKSI